MTRTYTVAVSEGIKYECLANEGLHVKCGDDVIIRFDKYEDSGRVEACTGEGCCGDGEEGTSDASSDKEWGRKFRGGKEPEIVRVMTLVDKGKAHENEARAKSMFRTGQRKITEHNLNMKLINCHYTFDKSLAIFLFVADGRVDFRDLVRDLSGALHTRVELRQIGVRDEASIQGGLGPCGRPFCCATVLKSFESVNVRMAKAQRISLNPNSVSGGCGRLKCCLRYEVEGYKEMFRQLPRSGTKCETPEGPGRVLDCNALTRMVRVRLENQDGQIRDFPADDINVKDRKKSERRKK
ncbi:MAG: stage 0 sporulation protein [Candidatus Pacebacteria bacterium]|nr:stage 0 sporulation protein [Candidatus Paceibacterota bacterium]